MTPSRVRRPRRTSCMPIDVDRAPQQGTRQRRDPVELQGRQVRLLLDGDQRHAEARAGHATVIRGSVHRQPADADHPTRHQ
jgi:hypothetical protein